MGTGDSVFEFLFKYPLAMFQQGVFELSAPWQMYLAAVVAAAIAVPTLLYYSRVKGKTSTVDRVILSVLRTSVLAVILFSLFQPFLVLSTTAPQRNFVGILLDDSRSMRINDSDGEPRADFIREALDPEQGELFEKLAEKFSLRWFRFAAGVERIDSGAPLSFAGGKTDLGRALEHARQELSGLPLAGLIVVSDGADNADTPLAEPLLALRASSIPVYTVGLGRESFAKDIELTGIQLPREVLNGTSLVAELMIRQSGYAGAAVPLIVEDDGRIVNSQTVELRDDGEAVTARVRFTVTEPGPRRLRFRIPVQSDEAISQNNQQEVLVFVYDRKERILYFEGEPRFELKFLRRAVADDKNIQVVTLLRTAENKFYRLGIDDPDELLEGFPKRREELFAYRGLILGNIEASYFTPDQLQMIADFVSQRGGGLLLLGGRRAFAEGGYGDTPLADVLPVVLDGKAAAGFARDIVIEPTPAGKFHPVTQITAAEAESAERWATLPPLTVVNPIVAVKPGATTLLRGNGAAEPLIALAFQRYGRGKVVAFPVKNSWLWQMHQDVPLEDQSHETFWRQLLRWLVSSVPARARVVVTPADRVAPDEPVTLIAEVEDDAYLPINDAEVQAVVTSPTGEERELTLAWTVDRNGEYRATFVPQEQGLYELRVQVRGGEEPIPESETYLHVNEQAREYHQAEMRSSILKRIAEETGGGFYTPDTVTSLPDDIQYTRSGITVVEQRELWDMPIIFFLIVGLASAEWGYRKWRGLV